MKLWSTTPVSKGLATKSALVAVAVMISMSGAISGMPVARADQFDDQMYAINQKMQQYQRQANELSAKASSLQAELTRITNEKNALIAQLDLTQQKYDLLTQQIADTKVKIQQNKDALGDTIVDMYADDSISSLEMLASSKNIGDYVDKQEYRTAVRNNLDKTIKDIQDLQAKLKKSQDEVQKVLEEQKTQKAAIEAKEAEQADLVARTRNDEAAYQQLVNDSRAQLQSVAAQQQAYFAALRRQNGGSFNSGVVGSFVFDNFSGNMGCSGGYPYCGPQDTSVDPWQLYNRECVSYAAWRIDQVYGRRVQPFGGAGNAYQWGQGSAIGAWRVTDPQPGDAVVLPIMSGFAPVGHLMVVEGVSNGWVHVSQYNFGGTGEYSTMDIRTSGVIFLRFPNK